MGFRRIALLFLFLALAIGACDDGADSTPRIVYFSARVGELWAPWQVFVVRSDGSAAQQLTPTAVFDNDEPEASPDGRLIAFASKRDFPPPAPGEVQNPTLRLIYLMNADGGGVRRLTANSWRDCSEHYPRFAPAGDWIVFEMSCDNIEPPFVERVFRVRPEGGGLRQYDPRHPDLDPSGNQGRPAFDTAGARILFIGETSQAHAFEVFSMDLEGGDVRRLTRNADADRTIASRNALSVQGNQVYFVSDDQRFDSEAARLESVPIDGSGPQRTVRLIENLSSPEWLAGVPRDFDLALTPDGDRLVFVSYDDSQADPPTLAVVVSNLDGSDRRTIRGPGQFARPLWHSR